MGCFSNYSLDFDLVVWDKFSSLHNEDEAGIDSYNFLFILPVQLEVTTHSLEFSFM